MEARKSRPPPKISHRYMEPPVDPFAQEPIAEVPEEHSDSAEISSDSAEISSGEEIESVPKKALNPLLNTSNFIKPSLKSITGKLSPRLSPRFTEAVAAAEFSSTNESSDPPLSLQLSISSSPRAAGAATSPKNTPLSPEELVEPPEEVAARLPNPSTQPKVCVFPKGENGGGRDDGGGGEENIPDSIIKVEKKVHQNMISHPDMKLLLIRGKAIGGLLHATAATKQGGATGMVTTISPRAICDFKEGYLEKQSSSLLTCWKEKYCRVGHSKYMFFKNIQTGLLSGIIDFQRVPADIWYDEGYLTFTIRIGLGDSTKSFTFRVINLDELNKWVRAIAYHIEKNRTVVDYPRVMPRINYYWKFRLISEKDFLGRVETGDLLLFTGGRVACKLQRLITRSRFGTTFFN